MYSRESLGHRVLCVAIGAVCAGCAGRAADTGKTAQTPAHFTVHTSGESGLKVKRAETVESFAMDSREVTPIQGNVFVVLELEFTPRTQGALAGDRPNMVKVELMQMKLVDGTGKATPLMASWHASEVRGERTKPVLPDRCVLRLDPSLAPRDGLESSTLGFVIDRPSTDSQSFLFSVPAQAGDYRLLGFFDHSLTVALR